LKKDIWAVDEEFPHGSIEDYVYQVPGKLHPSIGKWKMENDLWKIEPNPSTCERFTVTD
jgi:hypothetical protein